MFYGGFKRGLLHIGACWMRYATLFWKVAICENVTLKRFSDAEFVVEARILHRPLKVLLDIKCLNSYFTVIFNYLTFTTNDLWRSWKSINVVAATNKSVTTNSAKVTCIR